MNKKSSNQSTTIPEYGFNSLTYARVFDYVVKKVINNRAIINYL